MVTIYVYIYILYMYICSVFEEAFAISLIYMFLLVTYMHIRIRRRTSDHSTRIISINIKYEYIFLVGELNPCGSDFSGGNINLRQMKRHEMHGLKIIRAVISKAATLFYYT